MTKTCLFTAIFKDDPLEFAVRELARIGYEAVELRAMSHLPLESSDEEVQEIGRMIHGYGLEVAGIYVRGGLYSELSDAECQQQIENVTRYAEMGQMLGARFVVDWPGGPTPDKAVEADWQRAARWLARSADAAARFGIQIALELHFGGLVESAADAMKLLDLIDRENVGVIYDAGNLVLTPAPFGPEVIRQLGSRIIHFHVKDESRFGADDDPSRAEMHGRVFWHRFLGQGEADHAPLFQAMKDMGYQGYLSAECHAQGHTPTHVAEQEYQAMQEILARLT